MSRSAGEILRDAGIPNMLANRTLNLRMQVKPMRCETTHFGKQCPNTASWYVNGRPCCDTCKTSWEACGNVCKPMPPSPSDWVHSPESTLASLCDYMNTYAREQSVEESTRCDLNSMRALLDRLLAAKMYAYQYDHPSVCLSQDTLNILDKCGSRREAWADVDAAIQLLWKRLTNERERRATYEMALHDIRDKVDEVV